MTVSYTFQCATPGLATFFRLLLRWRGSIYKLVYKELIIFLALYYILSFTYRFALDEYQRTVFEKTSLTFGKYMSFVPIVFVLSFYVSTIVDRWWQVFNAIAWVDRAAMNVATYVEGADEKTRNVRRTVIRYLNLAHIFVLRDISSVVRKRFPSVEQVMKAGFITEEELDEYLDADCAYQRYLYPIQWCCTLLEKSFHEGRVSSEYRLEHLIEEILLYRNQLQNLINYDWISVPLVYTQVVTIAVYSFFFMCLMARQFLDPSKQYAGYEADMYFPLFTVFELLFYVGWLKVAETLINPLGEDDDDFELNYILDRNLQVGFCIVDANCDKLAPLERDIHWNELLPEVPHTEASYGLMSHGPVESTDSVEITAHDALIASADVLERRRSRKLSRVGGSRRVREFIHNIGEHDNLNGHHRSSTDSRMQSSRKHSTMSGMSNGFKTSAPNSRNGSIAITHLQPATDNLIEPIFTLPIEQLVRQLSDIEEIV